MDIGDMPNNNIKKWVVVYPVYINSKKTIAEGRRINVSKACENPTCAEIGDCCAHFKLPFAIEVSSCLVKTKNSVVRNICSQLHANIAAVDWLFSCRLIKLIRAISCKEGECGCCLRKMMALPVIQPYLQVRIISINQFEIYPIDFANRFLYYVHRTSVQYHVYM